MVLDPVHQTQRLFAVDLNLRLCDSAAGYQLFDLLMQGQARFDGSYEIDAAHLPPKSSSSSSSSPLNDGTALVAASAPGKAKRHYAIINYLYHPGLAAIPHHAFFNLCRLNGVAFDLQQKEGNESLIFHPTFFSDAGVLK